MKNNSVNYEKENAEKKRLILTTVIMMSAVVAVYLISVRFGGGFHSFGESAVGWVLLGIGAAGGTAYASVKNSPKETNSERKDNL